MAKTKVSQWDSVAANNTDINTININEGCPPSTINNAIRETMAQIKNWQDGSSGDGWTSTGTITSSGSLAINGSVYLDGSLGTNGQVLTSVGSTNTPVWSSLGTMSAQNSNAVAITGGAVNVTGSLTMDGATGSSGQFLTSGGSSATPTWTSLVSFTTGMIILWSGSVASIPSGWALCNGSSGTPDLRNRFVVGAGSTYNPNNTGGSATATLPSHTHTASTSTTGAHAHSGSTNTVGNHVHPYGLYNSSVIGGAVGARGGQSYSGLTADTNGAGAHSHTVSIPSSGTHNHTVSVNSSGTSATNANLPPYYALAYIMKL